MSYSYLTVSPLSEAASVILPESSCLNEMYFPVEAVIPLSVISSVSPDEYVIFFNPSFTSIIYFVPSALVYSKH